MKKETVAVLGASTNPDRYSNKAIRSLLAHGHEVIPIHPIHTAIEGLHGVKSMSDIARPIDTLTVYVGPDRGIALVKEIAALKPARVILNPGAESKQLVDALHAEGLNVVEGCTLVMLSTDQF